MAKVTIVESASSETGRVLVLRVRTPVNVTAAQIVAAVEAAIAQIERGPAPRESWDLP